MRHQEQEWEVPVVSLAIEACELFGRRRVVRGYSDDEGRVPPRVAKHHKVDGRVLASRLLRQVLQGILRGSFQVWIRLEFFDAILQPLAVC